MAFFSLRHLNVLTAAALPVALLLGGCAPGQDEPAPTTGVLDVSNYVAVGDSYTAGVSADGLTLSSQQYAYPNLLAQQFQRVSPSATFSQPVLAAGGGTGYLELTGFDANGLPQTRRVSGPAMVGSVTAPGPCGGSASYPLLAASATPGTLPQNLGLPGLRLSQLETAGYGNAATASTGTGFNPYFARLLPAGDNRSYLQALSTVAAPATFFTYFQGLDDIMPFLLNGGECKGSPAELQQLGNQMKLNAKKVLDVLTANGRRGIIAGLPAPATLPLLRQGQGLLVQQQQRRLHNATDTLFIQNRFDPLGSPAEPIIDKDYVLATALSRVGVPSAVTVNGATLMLPYGLDRRNPLRDADVLDQNELSQLSDNVVNAYNNELNRLARDVYKLPLLNTATKFSSLNLNNALFDQVADQISVAGVVYSTEPVRGGVFSLDYYTLTPRGNALLANTFIRAINQTYKASIPFVDVNALPTTAN